jgi:hypothetical protein
MYINCNENESLGVCWCRISNFKNSRDEQGVWVCCVNILVIATVQVPFKTVHVLRATSTCVLVLVRAPVHVPGVLVLVPCTSTGTGTTYGTGTCIGGRLLLCAWC